MMQADMSKCVTRACFGPDPVKQPRQAASQVGVVILKDLEDLPVLSPQLGQSVENQASPTIAFLNEEMAEIQKQIDKLNFWLNIVGAGLILDQTV